MEQTVSTKIINVVIRKKDGVLWQGEADSLTSTNEIGVFDVLPQHTHFVGLIEQYLVVRIGYQELRWPIDKGILSVGDGVVEAYLGY